MTEARTDIEILGQRLVVRGEGSPEYIRGLADYLDARIRSVRDHAHVYDPLRLSLLAGLHVVDELSRARAREATLATRIDELTSRLREALAAEGPDELA